MVYNYNNNFNICKLQNYGIIRKNNSLFYNGLIELIYLRFNEKRNPLTEAERPNYIFYEFRLGPLRLVIK